MKPAAIEIIKFKHENHTRGPITIIVAESLLTGERSEWDLKGHLTESEAWAEIEEDVFNDFGHDWCGDGFIS